MAVFEQVGEVLFESSPLGKVLIGVGVLAVAPVAIPALRPVTKSVIKGGMGLTHQVRRALAETGEKWSDLVAEARAEMAASAAEPKVVEIAST
jgi:hypothetical protein